MKNSFFLFVFVSVFVGMFVLLNIAFFRYEGKMSIAIVPKTLLGAVALEEITSLSADIFTSFHFLENVLLAYPQLEKYDALSKKEEKIQTSLWKKRTETSLRGSIVELRYSAHNEYEAEQVLRASANVLIKNISIYYTIQKDIQVEIFERPVITKRSFFLDILISFFVGLGISLGVRFFLKKKSKSTLEWKPLSTQNEIPERLYTKRSVGEKKEKYEKEKVVLEKKEETHQKEENSSLQEEKKLYGNHLETFSQEMRDDSILSHQQLPIISSEKKEGGRNDEGVVSESAQRNTHGFVPTNLPIILEEDSFLSEEKKEISQEEPTNEEYKRRLNELLNGKMIV